MLKIARPEDDGRECYRQQVSRTRDRVLRTDLLAQSATVGRRVAEYTRRAQAAELYRLVVEDRGEIGAKMADLYDRVLVRGGGRPLYKRIRGSAKFGRCPMCAQRDVRTVDHYLPKERYPEFSVFPANLVPCCSDCNKTKDEYVATRLDEQIFHPYFDDWGVQRILEANIQVAGKIDVTFQIREIVPGVPRETLARASSHFELLQLGSLYAAGAAVELVESKAIFQRNFLMGADALRAELEYTAASRQAENLNSWRAALYWGLSSSDEFCRGGFELIEQ